MSDTVKYNSLEAYMWDKYHNKPIDDITRDYSKIIEETTELEKCAEELEQLIKHARYRARVLDDIKSRMIENNPMLVRAKRSGPDDITVFSNYTISQVERMRLAYQKAVKSREASFTFEERLLPTDFALHLLNYLESYFGLKDPK